MKGFGIYIKNTLLDPKHVEAMGQAVWLYMWFIDHMTSIDEKGVGKVLGGRPVKYEEIEKELGISQDTYTRWIARLEEYPYIITTRTPYGIVYRVLKADKRFRKNAERVRKPAESNRVRDVAESNKTNHYESNTNQDTSEQSSQDKQKNKDIAEMIDLFKVVNPAHGRLFQMNPQRQAAERLLKMKTVEGWAKFMEVFAVKMQTDPYCPKATTPSQLEAKLGAIIAYGNSIKAKEMAGGKGRGFA